LLEKGKYEKAITKSLKSFTSSKDKPKSLQTIETAYNLLLEQSLQKIDLHLASNNIRKEENILGEYKKLQELYQQFQRYPDIFSHILPINYNTEVTQYTELAVNTRYELGMQYLNSHSKADFIQAFHEFDKALKLAPNDKDILDRRAEALALAVTNVGIDYPYLNRRTISSEWESVCDNMYVNVVQDLTRNNKRLFIKFLPLKDMVSHNYRTDHYILMDVEYMNVPHYRVERDKKSIIRTEDRMEIVDGKEIIKKYTYKAELIKEITRVKPQMRLRLSILDDENRTLLTQIFQEEYEWVHEYVTFTGDKQALSGEQLNLVQSSVPSRIPNNQQLMKPIIDQIQGQMLESIERYYKEKGLL